MQSQPAEVAFYYSVAIFVVCFATLLRSSLAVRTYPYVHGGGRSDLEPTEGVVSHRASLSLTAMSFVGLSERQKFGSTQFPQMCEKLGTCTRVSDMSLKVSRS